MFWSFKAHGQAVPPWREHAAMLTKWRPRQPTAAAGVSPAGASPPGSPPAPCSCHGAGAAQAAAVAQAAAAAEATAAQPVSPCSTLQAPAAGFEEALQAAAAWACAGGALGTPPLPALAARAGGRPTSLLSRSLERRAASLGPPSQLLLPAMQPDSWWEPRTIRVVRRSA